MKNTDTITAGERTQVQFMSPTGAQIVGSLERLSGVAEIEGFEPNGEPIYSGNTEIYWDEQRTVIRDDEHVFVDVNGEEWLQSQLIEIPATAAFQAEEATL